jgi:hypothetical protein
MINKTASHKNLLAHNDENKQVKNDNKSAY